MWQYEIEDRILATAISNETIAIGCENGWIHVFDKKSRIWAKKLASTYYRGPFTDVNVISIDVNEHVAAGTDFADGKLYLFSKNGKVRWERQLISIMGCWERPDDVERVRLGEYIAAGSGFLNDYIHLFSLDGERLFQKRISGRVKAIEMGYNMAVGTSEKIYFFDYDGRILLTKDVEVEDVKIIDDVTVVASITKILGHANGEWWVVQLNDSNSQGYPRISVGRNIVAALGNMIYEISREGEIISTTDVGKEISCIYSDRKTIFAGTADGIAVIRDTVEWVKSECVVGIGGAGVVSMKGTLLTFYPLKTIYKKTEG